MTRIIIYQESIPLSLEETLNDIFISNQFSFHKLYTFFWLQTSCAKYTPAPEACQLKII